MVIDYSNIDICVQVMKWDKRLVIYVLVYVKESIKLSRYFADLPIWTAYNRPADDHPARCSYLKSQEG